ncbi:hypothetical protein IMSHALPRED_004476 [Imshaugia aleurites]|uniref:Uncharacterized protein n=1 Tax=Imshaugia aleurites TaxID=172621 RepID=A0A8H3J939_9LECA|nr:hypothetical protein IMSHALPRED_004476 [Imshaugia aleurites]
MGTHPCQLASEDAYRQSEIEFANHITGVVLPQLLGQGRRLRYQEPGREDNKIKKSEYKGYLDLVNAKAIRLRDGVKKKLETITQQNPTSKLKVSHELQAGVRAQFQDSIRARIPHQCRLLHTIDDDQMSLEENAKKRNRQTTQVQRIQATEFSDFQLASRGIATLGAIQIILQNKIQRTSVKCKDCEFTVANWKQFIDEKRRDLKQVKLISE